MRIDIDNAHGVMFSILADVQQRDVSDVFRRGLHRHARRGVKGWIRHQGHIHILLLRGCGKDLSRPMFQTARRRHKANKAATAGNTGMTRPVNIRDPASSRGFTRGSWAAASITLLLITGPRLQIALGSPMRFERVYGQSGSYSLGRKTGKCPSCRLFGQVLRVPVSMSDSAIWHEPR